MKKLEKEFGPINRPIIIVGEKMGKQRLGESTYALEGNRTGDFVHEAIGKRTNIILTNIVNYYYEGNFDRSRYVREGLIDLIWLFGKTNPSKIICLGNIAFEYVSSIDQFIPDGMIEIVSFPHPSWINRFQSSNRHNYLKQLSDAIS